MIKIDRNAHHLDELQDKLRSTCLLRRLKADVLTELPAKRRQIIELPASTPELRAVLNLEAEALKRADADVARLQAAVGAASAGPAAYAKAVAALKAAQQIAFTEMSRVRHQTAVAKAPVVAQHVREAAEAGGKIIVFAHHQDVVGHLVDALSDLGVVSVTGLTPPAKRQDAVDAFQNDSSIRIFVGNIQAAGVGITLTASSHVVFGELDWVPGNLSQAEDRANRLGQKSSVLVQHLVLEGSIDARMAETVTEKQKTIDAALDTVETTEARETRLAAEQAAKDAVVAAALAEAKAGEAAAAKRAADRETQEIRRAEDRATVEAIRVADAVQRAADRDAAIRASVAAKAATFGSVAAPIPEATTAIHACLRLLADLDPDKATERNGDGFGKGDSTHGAWLALQSSLSEADAITGRELCRRYRGQLGDRDADLLAMALGEVITARRVSKPRPVMTEPVSEPAATMPAVRTPEASPENLPLAWVEPKAALPIAALPISDTLGFLASPDVTNEDAPGANGPEQAADVIPHAHEPVRRGPGRPAKARQRQAALTQVERNRRYRETHTLIAMQVPLALVDRMRSARDARGLTTEQVLALAMNAVEAAECDETLTT